MYGYESFKVNLAMEVVEKDWVIVTSPRYCGLSVLRTPNEGRQMTVRYNDSWLYLFTSSSFYFVTRFRENFLSVFLAVTRFLKNFPSVLLAVTRFPVTPLLVTLLLVLVTPLLTMK